MTNHGGPLFANFVRWAGEARSEAVLVLHTDGSGFVVDGLDESDIFRDHDEAMRIFNKTNSVSVAELLELLRQSGGEGMKDIINKVEKFGIKER